MIDKIYPVEAELGKFIVAFLSLSIVGTSLLLLMLDGWSVGYVNFTELENFGGMLKSTAMTTTGWHVLELLMLMFLSMAFIVLLAPCGQKRGARRKCSWELFQRVAFCVLFIRLVSLLINIILVCMAMGDLIGFQTLLFCTAILTLIQGIGLVYAMVKLSQPFAEQYGYLKVTLANLGALVFTSVALFSCVVMMEGWL